MLRTLTIRDVVLIDRLEINFHSGLCVLTGETGAGKSILLDALGLALGRRADARLVRHGARQALVTAEFAAPQTSLIREILSEQDIVGDDGMLLRRVLGADGRSRAFVNDVPVSVSLLQRLGDALVDVHGQFESQRLLNPAIHRRLLDAYGDLNSLVEATRNAFAAWRRAADARARAEAELETARHDEEYLRHAADELAALKPEPGEEETLAARRSAMMHGEMLLEAMNQAVTELEHGRGAETAVRSALHHLERVSAKFSGRLDATCAALDKAASEIAEGTALLEKASSETDLDPRNLDLVEERLFSLRALARKHNTDVDGLPALQETLTARLATLEDGGANLERLQRGEVQSRASFSATATRLTEARHKAAARLDAAVADELGPLQLSKAVFTTLIESLAEKNWGEYGCDRAIFQVATNPGASPGRLNKIASGGELARFMLALKAVLAEADPVPTIVFDEVDSSIGGATAAAVGERLARLAEQTQVLVVTHSPQVAARGAHHWQVSKQEMQRGAMAAGDGNPARGPCMLTTVDALTKDARKEEIARMLAGAKITDEARAAADSLLHGQQP
ncbi:MAG TPA: DNA repair protein RecN [Rhodospirillales bacterium]|jgi:DNA repair protein RecN (Recombination protein N)|nr:DNA repair protein RecN [Rhodospirillales bacterium]